MTLETLIIELIRAAKMSEDGLDREVAVGSASSATDLSEIEATRFLQKLGAVVIPANPHKPVTLTRLLSDDEE